MQLQFLKNASLNSLQSDTTLLASNKCWVRLHTLLLRVVGSCCGAKFETGQTFSYVKTDTTTPAMLGVVASLSNNALREVFYWYKAVIFTFPSKTSLTLSCLANKGALIESFRFEDEDDYEYEI